MISSRPITVLIAEDHTLVRQGLCSLLNADGHFRVVGEASNGRKAVQLARSVRPDVILMDISMPLLNGVEATRQILASDPAAKIVILSAHTDDNYVEEMIEAGVFGFLEKHTSAEILIGAIGQAANGKIFLGPSILRRRRNAQSRSRRRNGLLKVNGPKLTAREREVLQLVAESLANKQIAAELVIGIKTVEKHRQSLMDKLGIHDTAGLTRYAIAAGVVEVGAKLTIT